MNLILWLIGILFVLSWPTILLFNIFGSMAFYANISALVNGKNNPDLLQKTKQQIARVWILLSNIWHGHEIVGIEKIPGPNEEPALIIYYHSAFPIEFFYLLMKCIHKSKRPIAMIVDKFVMKIPGFSLLVKMYDCTSGSVESCVETLQSGKSLAIAPGGVYEGLFSDETYNILWRNRVGFAKVALQAKVPIIPVFTRNCQEVFRTPSYKKYGFIKSLYEVTRSPLILPMYGGFPVKLITYVGDPIPYDPNLTPEDLAVKAKVAMAKLISTHQTVPGQIVQGLKERWSACKQS